MLVLLPELLQGLGSTRLIIDGIDEWDALEQKDLLKDLMLMLSADPSSYICKALISSRETLDISRTLRKRNKAVVTISLSDNDESLAITHSIRDFVDNRLSELPEHFSSLDPDGSILDHIKHSLLVKSNGTYLLSLDNEELTGSRHVLVGTVSSRLTRIHVQP